MFIERIGLGEGTPAGVASSHLVIFYICDASGIGLLLAVQVLGLFLTALCRFEGWWLATRSVETGRYRIRHADGTGRGLNGVVGKFEMS